jgi:nitrate/nitrite transporter NarK
VYRHTLWQALGSAKVLTLSAVYFGFVGALYGMQFWLPQIVKAFGFSNAQTGFVTAVPYLFCSARWRWCSGRGIPMPAASGSGTSPCRCC